jgi:ferredoxin--NADP+ reductase
LEQKEEIYLIRRKEVLSDAIKLIEVDAPRVARKARPGQFVILRIDETGERIPMTLADCDSQVGTLTIVFQEVGKSTRQMGQLEVGDGFQNIAGPLGHPSEIQNYGTVVVVGGGVGIAAVFPITKALKQAGNHVISIIGTRSRAMLFWEERMSAYSDELIVCTDDGSAGRKALVTEPLQEILSSRQDIARVWAIGPAVMMKRVSEVTRPFEIPAIVSLNTIMIDGTGMCGGCRVALNQEVKFVCVDGPEFDGREVDWDNLLSRLSFYRSQEKAALERWEDHRCQIGLQTANPEAAQAPLVTRHDTSSYRPKSKPVEKHG